MRARSAVRVTLAVSAAVVTIVATGFGSSPLRGSATLQMVATADTWGWRTVVPNPHPPPATHGGEPALVTGVDDTRGIQVALVRFDLASVAPEAQIDAAWLELFTLPATEGGVRSPTSVHTVVAPWDEDTVTDEALPAYNGADIAPATPVDGEWARWDVSAQVRSWLAGAPNFGLALWSGPDLFVQRSFGSRESDHPPRLVITARGPNDPTPTPAPPLPDLTGSAWMGCYSNLVHMTIRNQGVADAGSFAVQSTQLTHGNPEPGWRVPGVAAGATIELEPIAGSSAPIAVDAYGEVAESDEANNTVCVAVPRCLPLVLPFAWR